MSKSSSYSSSKPVFTDASTREQQPFFSGNGPEGVQTKEEDPFFQAKLSIGAPNDKFEKEADNVADKVVQRLATPLEDENFSTNEERMKRDRELRTKPEIQQKCSHCEQEEKTLQKKEEPSTTSSSLSNRIDNSRGHGSPLPANTLSEMQTSFGHDFSGVKIHTDAESVSMNRELGAQAFTHGSDIYFNTGKFNPDSSTGKHLLAHELTHVVQQNAAQSHLPVQRQPSTHIPEAHNQFYGHGAFMAAAPQMMADKKWNRILEVLMPDVHAAATNTISKAPASDELILEFENNPVMAAYGMYQTKQMDTRKDNGRSDRIAKMEAMEWDVFLPTKIVDNFNKAAHDKDKARLAQDMVNEMIIAHGTRAQTTIENLPSKLLSSRQYENVKKTPKAGQGGVRPGAWMDLFGKALDLAADTNWEKKAKEYTDPVLHPRINSPQDQAADKTFKNQLPFQQVISAYKRVFGKDRFSVLLDIKSRDASPTVLGALVNELNRRGIFVYGVGTFQHHEITGLSKKEQKVDGHAYAGPKEVKFFHLAGNLQNDCLSDKIHPGDTVMFNAGSLISYKIPLLGKPKTSDYAIKTDVVDQLRIYKKHYGFKLGVYVQENDIDPVAATLVTEVTNRHPDIFDLGFAWGGLGGQAASDIAPSHLHATVGMFGQDTIGVGKHWDTDRKGPSLLAAHSQQSSLVSELTYQEAQDRINAKDLAGAFQIVMADLIATGKVNTRLFTYKFVDDPKQGEGLTASGNYKKDPKTGKYSPVHPSEMTIYPKAFSSVQWLVSSIMHEYQHVLQQQRPIDHAEIVSEDKGGRAGESSAADEVEAYLWEMEHINETGVSAHPGSIAALFKRLTDHYNDLGQFNPAHQAMYTDRYVEVSLLVSSKTKEEDELEKCDNDQLPPDQCKKLYDKVRNRYGNKERNYNFHPDKDVNKKKIRRDDAPVIDSFRMMYNRLDSWDILVRKSLGADAHEVFEGLFKLNENRLKWLSQLKEQTAGYKSDFRNVSNFDIAKTRKDFEQQTLKRIEGEINALNRSIATWYKVLSGDPDDLDTIMEKAHKAGTELWREEWKALILAVNRVLSRLWPPARQRIIAWVEQQRKIHPGADLSGNVDEIDYVGSLATGYKGAPKQFVRFNVNKFDVDANLEAPPLAKFAMTFDHIKPDRKRIFTIGQGTSITPLIEFCHDTQQSLSGIKGYDVKEQFDVVLNAPELADQKRGREGTERLYNLRDKLGESRYNTMINEIKAAGLLEEADTGWRLKGELSKDETRQLNNILKKYE